MLAQLEAMHPDDLRLIFRHFPLLSLHDKASLAGEAAEAAGAQGAFWDMHDVLFERFTEWVSLTPDGFISWLENVSMELGLDTDRFMGDLEGRRYADDMVAAFERNVASGLPGTPMVYLNGNLYRLPLTLLNMEASIRLEGLLERQYGEYPAFTINLQKEYLARLQLRQGEVVIQLLPGSAPLAVNSFIFLAHEGWYDGNPFHLVQTNRIVETGDPSGTGLGDPGYHFVTEIDAALTFDQVGMVALVSAGPDTNGSQFMINLQPIPELNGERTIFGRVIQGLDLLQNLEQRDPLLDLLTEPEEIILSVTIEEQ